MKLHLLREPTANDRTFGVLFLNGHFFCHTLEDAIRQPGPMSYHAVSEADAWVRGWKVKGQTAIPFGTYEVVLTNSARFGRVMPEIIGVPGFSGIRIRAGNTIKDTEGCPLVGYDRTTAKVLRSTAAFYALFERLSTAAEARGPVTVTVVPPLVWGDALQPMPAPNARSTNV